MVNVLENILIFKVQINCDFVFNNNQKQDWLLNKIKYISQRWKTPYYFLFFKYGGGSNIKLKFNI